MGKAKMVSNGEMAFLVLGMALGAWLAIACYAIGFIIGLVG